MLCMRARFWKLGSNFHLKVRFSSSNSSSNSSTKLPDFNLHPKFNNAEQEKILCILNQSNRDQLLCLNVAQSKIKNLENYKKRNGPFKSLDELLDVDGLSMKMSEKLCKQIISDLPVQNTSKPSNNDNRRLKQILAPPLPVDMVISSSVGIHLAAMGISWAKINQFENKLECWGYQDFGNLPKKMCPTDTFKQAIDILNQLPVGSAYVLEGTSNMGLQGQKQPSTVTSYTQQMELSSMLLALINSSKKHNNTYHQNEESDSCETITNCVFFLRSKLPARLFKTLVGNECVSNTATVLHLLGDSPLYNFSLPCSPITLDQKVKNDYLTQSPAHKELLGQALMLTVAFTDLCVKKNPISIKAILPSKK